jgi:hypothetical protein
MKKNLLFLGLVVIFAAFVVSCDDDEGGGDPTVKASLIKSIEFNAEWADGAEMWEFMYDATSKKVTKFDNYWEGDLDKTVTYDYTTAGMLTLMKGSEIYHVYDINAQGYITKDDDGNTFMYDANGYLIKYYEFWDDADHLKYEMTISNGNIMKITTYDDDGVTAKKFKEFTYIGDNVNEIHQANAIDSEWKPMGNFYGKPSKKLVDFFEYWDPRENPIVKKKSSLVYAFDDKDRVSTATKTLSDATTEVWTYTYYEE